MITAGNFGRIRKEALLKNARIALGKNRQEGRRKIPTIPGARKYPELGQAIFRKNPGHLTFLLVPKHQFGNPMREAGASKAAFPTEAWGVPSEAEIRGIGVTAVPRKPAISGRCAHSPSRISWPNLG
jgi:hypothetical protein